MTTPNTAASAEREALTGNQLEAIAHNLCSLHGFAPAWVAGQERFAKAVITEYERARQSAPPVEAGGVEPVAWQRRHHPAAEWIDCNPDDVAFYQSRQEVRPLYTHPAPDPAGLVEAAEYCAYHALRATQQLGTGREYAAEDCASLFREISNRLRAAVTAAKEQGK